MKGPDELTSPLTYDQNPPHGGSAFQLALLLNVFNRLLRYPMQVICHCF